MNRVAAIVKADLIMRVKVIGEYTVIQTRKPDLSGRVDYFIDTNGTGKMEKFRYQDNHLVRKSWYPCCDSFRDLLIATLMLTTEIQYE